MSTAPGPTTRSQAGDFEGRSKVLGRLLQVGFELLGLSQERVPFPSTFISQLADVPLSFNCFVDFFAWCCHVFPGLLGG